MILKRFYLGFIRKNEFLVNLKKRFLCFIKSLYEKTLFFAFFLTKFYFEAKNNIRFCRNFT